MSALELRGTEESLRSKVRLAGISISGAGGRTSATMRTCAIASSRGTYRSDHLDDCGSEEAVVLCVVQLVGNCRRRRLGEFPSRNVMPPSVARV